MKFTLVKQSVNVIWISSIITPFTFSKEWFSRYELLREEDIINSNISLGNDAVSSDYGWIEVVCAPTRAMFQLTKTGLENSLIDLTKSIFTMFEHAETQAIGINTLFSYEFEKKDDWEKIGNALVPKNLWETNNKSKLLQDNVKYHYGMKSLIIAIENTSSANPLYEETINVTYTPSVTEDNSGKKTYNLNVQYNHDLSAKSNKCMIDLTKELSNIIHEQITEALRNDVHSHETMFTQVLS